MKDRIIRVFPTLVDEARVGLARIFDKAIAIRIAKIVDPQQSGLDIRPDRRDRSDIPGSVEIHASKHDKQRRRIDGPVIVPERHFPETRHFAIAAVSYTHLTLPTKRIV